MRSLISRSTVLVAVAIASLLSPAPASAQTDGPGNDERIDTPGVQIDDQLASLWAHFTIVRPGESRISSCGANLFLLRKGPDGWKIFQIAATSRTEGCRPIAR